MNIKKTYNGETLRERRIELGFDESDVYRKLHIPEEYLNAIETGDFSRLPGSTYTLGFLKTYCNFLGIDSGEYIDSFRETTRPATGFLGMQTNKEPSHASLMSDIFTWAAICAVLVLAWIAYAVVIQPETEEMDSRVKAGTIEMVVPESLSEQ